MSPTPAIDEDGDVVIAWMSRLQDGSGYGIFAQRYVQTAPPSVQSVQINDDTSQRARVTSLSVVFSTQVSFDPSILTAFSLIRSGGGAVSFSTSSNVINNVTVVTLNNFTGLETQSGSLRDGNYTLTALASQISANGQQMAANYQYRFHRFYGDMNGDRRVDIADFGFFSLAFNQPLNYNAALDFNNDGRIDVTDLGQFSVRFFTTLP